MLRTMLHISLPLTLSTQKFIHVTFGQELEKEVRIPLKRCR